jgi:hypothetical protein
MTSRATIPLLHDGSLPPVALLVQWLTHITDPATACIHIEQMPPGNGSLPDLFAGAGIRQVSLSRPPISGPFRWDGWAGGRVFVLCDDEKNEDTNNLPIHHGDLPNDLPLDHADLGVLGLIDHARLEDANAVTHRENTTSGAVWEQIIHAISTEGTFQAPNIPPLAHQGTPFTSNHLGAWNPLPFARRAVISWPVPAGTPPWGLRDASGARHPVQVVEGPLGREILTSLSLEALAATDFAPLFDPVPPCHWEVTRTVIDNGRVRAELDPLGQIVRLCTDGRFVDWSGPALQPLVNGLPFSGQTTTTVLEEGPARARIAVNRVGPSGQLHVMYTLHAHDEVLRVAVSWNGEHEISLDFPTTNRSAPMEVAGDLASWLVKQRHDLRVPDRPLIPGIRWARIHDRDDAGLAIIGSRPLTVSALNGRMTIHVHRTASFALCENARPNSALTLSCLSLSLATPHRAATSHVLPGAFRLVGGHTVPWWVRRPEGWRGELLLGQQELRRSRTQLFIADCQEVQRCDLRGTVLQAVARSADGDSYDIDMAGGGLTLIRWR